MFSKSVFGFGLFLFAFLLVLFIKNREIQSYCMVVPIPAFGLEESNVHFRNGTRW